MKLPPLNAVRAFDAAARHLNLRRAAGDLFVTPGAISQQVRQLEQWLGVRLFDRRARGVELTEAGVQFHAVVARSLRQVAQAAERLRPERNTVTVSVLPSLGTRWLVPRLDEFTRAHPQVQVRIDATLELADFDSDGVDLAVRHVSETPRDLESIPICDELMYPVCSPAYFAAHVRRGRLAPQVRLLHEVSSRERIDHWERWLQQEGYDDVDAARGLYFSHEMLAADAAARGQGVAMLGDLLAVDAIRRGELVLASSQPLATGKRFLMVWPPGAVREPVRQFRDWLAAAFAAAVEAAAGALRPDPRAGRRAAGTRPASTAPKAKLSRSGASPGASTTRRPSPAAKRRR
jgi:LysR family glycine cleavage system transcriptional activator